MFGFIGVCGILSGVYTAVTLACLPAWADEPFFAHGGERTREEWVVALRTLAAMAGVSAALILVGIAGGWQ